METGIDVMVEVEVVETTFPFFSLRRVYCRFGPSFDLDLDFRPPVVDSAGVAVKVDVSDGVPVSG